MRIESIDVKNFKGLKDCNINLSADNDCNKELNLSIIIGENATFKTTLLELIMDYYKRLKLDPHADYEIKYQLMGKKYTGTFQNGKYYTEGAHTPDLNVYSFSYALIDRLKKLNAGFNTVNAESQTIRQFSHQLFLMVNISSKYNDINKVLKYLGSSIEGLKFLVVSKRRNSNFKIRVDEINHTLNLARNMARFIAERNYQASSDYKKLFTRNDVDTMFSYIMLKRKPEDLRIYFSSKNYISINLDSARKLAYDDLRYRAFELEDERDYYEREYYRREREYHELERYDAKDFIELFTLLIFIQQNMSSSFMDDYSHGELYDYVSAIQVKSTDPYFIQDAIWLYENVFGIVLISGVSLYKNDSYVEISDFSSGELSFIFRSIDLIDKVEENSIFLIDEPEVHLHPKWIKSYVSLLNDLFKKIDSHFIITTHSPMLVNNVNKNNLVVLKRYDNHIQQIDIDINPFAKSVDELLKEVFYTDVSETPIIEQYVSETSRLIENEETRAMGIDKYDELDPSATKMKLYLKYYDEIEGSKND